MSEDATTAQLEIPVTASGQEYVVQRRGNELVIGRSTEGAMLWQDETLPVGELPDDARSALDAGDTGSEPLQRALEAVVQAFVQRGG